MERHGEPRKRRYADFVGGKGLEVSNLLSLGLTTTSRGRFPDVMRRLLEI